MTFPDLALKPKINFKKIPHDSNPFEPNRTPKILFRMSQICGQLGQQTVKFFAVAAHVGRPIASNSVPPVAVSHISTSCRLLQAFAISAIENQDHRAWYLSETTALRRAQKTIKGITPSCLCFLMLDPALK